MKKIKIGTDVKIKIVISDLPSSLTMDDINFSVTFRSGGASVTKDKSALNVVDEEYIASLATADLAVGDLYMDVYAEVDDATFDDGIMHLIETVDLDAKIIP